MNTARLPVAIIGAGPVGLAAAAHLLARGEIPIILEAGPSVGHHIRQWGHVRMFTPWQYCVDRQAAALLAPSGWQHPSPDVIPTGGELVDEYLQPLASLAVIAPHLHRNARVVGVTRLGCDKVRTAGREHLPFVLRVAAPDGSMRRFEARAVIDASGTWGTPNPAGADGLAALGEAEAADRIATGIPDVLGEQRQRYADKTTAVVGSGHSALNALIDLARLQADHPRTFLLATGHEQVRSIAAALTGDAESAGRVELELPETGVCTTTRRVEAACCGMHTRFGQCWSRWCWLPSASVS
jgi:cation diffusion facilitator CzcD-associated flavoprotein CzcO